MLPEHGSECEDGGHAHADSARDGCVRDEEREPAQENKDGGGQVSLQQVEARRSAQMKRHDQT